MQILTYMLGLILDEEQIVSCKSKGEIYCAEYFNVLMFSFFLRTNSFHGNRVLLPETTNNLTPNSFYLF